ncbi:MAG: serine hydroxymethyltransferase, partial [Pseudomonadota bacterium]|nr:serine hydroxymethyltransferase [Pseudomonadota bacterium]
MSQFTSRPWVPDQVETYVREVAAETAAANPAEVAHIIDALIARNAAIHDRECFNLNPAANVMNPRAEAALAQGLGSRPS